MRRADRLFQLVQILRSRRFATAEQLAEELEISKRTVYRDVQDLQLSGVPIHGEAGVGYQLQRGYDLPPLTFNAEEIQALVLGARVVETWGDSDLAIASRSALAKVEEALPPMLRRLVLETAIFAPSGPWAQAVSSGWLGAVRKAVVEKRKMWLRYRRADGEESERTILPLGLYFWGTSWSVAAWCELREGYRNFRPDRMLAVKLLEERFEEEEGRSLADFVTDMERRMEAWEPRDSRR